jgi:A/G-specific adenine glycosylase
MSVAAASAKKKNAAAVANRPSQLLAWYDRHRRVLPWRAMPGEVSDPYRVWLSEIMLQQTTVKAVIPYFVAFTTRWPNVSALGSADIEDVMRQWAGLGYYSRARNLHACAVAVLREHGGAFPDTEDGLRKLPGVGPYTAAAIAAIAFGRATMPVDGNIERVVTRLYAIDEPLPKAKPLVQQLALTLMDAARAGDCAQALMDLGSSICTPKKPACALCPLNEDCAARARGDQEMFPRKAPKKSGALRRGAAFVVLRGDEILLRTRASKGLLGGMTEVPTSQWLADQDDKAARRQAPSLAGLSRWQRKAGIVEHVFTHFPLELVVYVARVPAGTSAPDGMRWVALVDANQEALPSVMRKVIAHGVAKARHTEARGTLVASLEGGEPNNHRRPSRLGKMPRSSG